MVPVISVVEPPMISDLASSSSTSIENEVIISAGTPPIFGIDFRQLKRAIKIKRKFLPAKLCYFLFYSSRSIFAMYYILFLTSTGLDPEQAGIINGIRMVVITLSALFWGILVDKSKKDITILTIKFIAFALLVFFKPWIAYWVSNNESPDEHRQHIKLAVQKTLQRLNSTQELKKIMENSDEVISSMFGLSWEVAHYNSGEIPLYVSMLGLGIASAFAGGAIHILIDTKVQQMTKECSRSARAYGRQRLWGSVAYSVTPVISGAILEASPVNKVSEYMPVFYLHLLFMMFGLFSCIALYKITPKQDLPATVVPTRPAVDVIPESPSKIVQPSEYESMSSLTRRMMKNINMITFFVHVLFIGIGNGLQWSFQFLLMEELGARKTTMGFCSFTQCLTESIMFSIASTLVKKIGGNVVARSVGIFGYFILFTSYALVKSPEYFMIPTCAVGFCFTLYYTASMDELYYIGNPKCMTSLYALYNSVLIGLGSAIAGSAGGVIYKKYGGRALYFGSAILYLVVGFLSVIYTILYKKSFIKGWDKHQVYTQFRNKASYVVKTGESPKDIPAEAKSQEAIVTSLDSLKSDEAIVLTMEAETVV